MSSLPNTFTCCASCEWLHLHVPFPPSPPIICSLQPHLGKVRQRRYIPTQLRPLQGFYANLLSKERSEWNTTLDLLPPLPPSSRTHKVSSSITGAWNPGAAFRISLPLVPFCDSFLPLSSRPCSIIISRPHLIKITFLSSEQSVSIVARAPLKSALFSVFRSSSTHDRLL